MLKNKLKIIEKIYSLLYEFDEATLEAIYTALNNMQDKRVRFFGQCTRYTSNIDSKEVLSCEKK